MNRVQVQEIVNESLKDCDDGELFLEYRQSETFSFDDGRLKAATFDTMQGFGLRTVAGETTGYAHASELSEDAIKRASDSIQAVKRGYSGSLAMGPARTNRRLYTPDNPLEGVPF